MTFLFLTVPFSSGPGLSILSSCSRNFAEIKVFLLNTSFPLEQDFLANVVITQKLYKLGVFWRLQGILWSLFGVWQYSRSVGTEPMVFLQLFEAPFPSLDTLQPINVPLAKRGPKLPPGFGGVTVLLPHSIPKGIPSWDSPAFWSGSSGSEVKQIRNVLEISEYF